MTSLKQTWVNLEVKLYSETKARVNATHSKPHARPRLSVAKKREGGLGPRGPLLSRRSALAGLGSLGLMPRSAFANDNAAFIFVGAGWCQVCKSAAPFLALFAQRRNIPVLVASADARPIEPFPSFADASTHPLAAQIDHYPTTLIYSAQQNAILASVEGFRDAAWYVGQLERLVQTAGA